MIIHRVILRRSRRISEFISDKLRDPSLTFRMTILASLLTLHFTLLTSIAIAADSTPSADIRSKLDELKKEIASKAAQLKQFVDKKLKDKAYIGKVKTKSASSVTLETKNGLKVVNISQDTQYDSDVSKKKYSQKLITEEDYLAALGDVDDTGALVSRKIILLPTPNPEAKTYLWGQIINISDKSVTLKDRNLKNTVASLPNQSGVKKSDFVILTGSFGKDDIFEADFVHVVPQGGIIKPRKIATSSATPIKTSSASATSKTLIKPASR